MNSRSVPLPLFSLLPLLIGAVACGATERDDPPSGSRLIMGVVLAADGEAGDQTLEDESGLIGYWYTYDDRQECVNPDVVAGNVVPCGAAMCAASGAMFAPMPNKNGGAKFAPAKYADTGATGPVEVGQEENKGGIHLTGGGNVEFGAGAGFGLNVAAAPQLFDLTVAGFTGLRFQARSGTPGSTIMLTVKIKDKYSEPAAMLCVERDNATCLPAQGCHDDPSILVMLTDQWTLFEKPFADFMRGGWGTHVQGMAPPSGALDPAAAYQVQFQVTNPVVGTPMPNFDVWIDNVGFTLGAAAPAPSVPGTAAPSGT